MAAGGFTNDFLTAFLMVLIKPQIFLLEKNKGQTVSMAKYSVFKDAYKWGGLHVVSLKRVSNA